MVETVLLIPTDAQAEFGSWTALSLRELPAK